MSMLKFHKAVRVAGWFFLVSLSVMLLVSLLKRNIYNPNLGVNLLMLARDGAGIISIRSSSGMISVLRLPDNLSIFIEKNKSEYLVEAISKFGLPMPDALNVARESVGQAFGIIISGVVKTNLEFGPENLRESILYVSTRTNFSIFDRYVLFKDLSKLLLKRISLSLSLPSKVYDRADEPDGKSVLRLNTAVFTWSRNQWLVDEILSETAEVSVVNATGVEGRGRVVARQIESAGVKVIELLSSNKVLPADCLLQENTKEHPITTDFLVSALGCKLSTDLNLQDYLTSDVRSDVVIVLGKKN